MQYSTFLQPVLLVLYVITCTTWASAIPTAKGFSSDVASVVAATNDEVFPYLIEEPHPDPQSSLGSTSFNPRSEPSFVKRYFRAPACWKAPNGYGHRDVVLKHGVPALQVNGDKYLIVPPLFSCGIAWCRNYKTHKTAIIVCAKSGFGIQRARVAGAAAKLANSCRRENWKVNGLLQDTTGYDVRVSGAGCP
ncbi:hypothetical protein TWF506_001847 [Arthrobotrys conoides]|uniref:Secreted protein n=1 Tax=Arthrobotrys conoides TaxID=74498 RepID=A0AAN8PSB6_9PEZI